MYIDRLIKDVDDSIPDIEEDIGMLMDMDTLADLGVIKVNPW